MSNFRYFALLVGLCAFGRLEAAQSTIGFKQFVLGDTYQHIQSMNPIKCKSQGARLGKNALKCDANTDKLFIGREPVTELHLQFFGSILEGISVVLGPAVSVATVQTELAASFGEFSSYTENTGVRNPVNGKPYLAYFHQWDSPSAIIYMKYDFPYDDSHQRLSARSIGIEYQSKNAKGIRLAAGGLSSQVVALAVRTVASEASII